MPETQTLLFHPNIDLIQNETRRPNNVRLIKSISDSQWQILRWIRHLYCPDGFDLDCTYRTGGFYRNGVMAPKFKTDIKPQAPGVMPGDATALPFRANCFKSVVFDPPFFATGSGGHHMKTFGAFESVPQLWTMYRRAMEEIWRVLIPQGYLVFKCQDFVHGRQQFLIHSDIIQYAIGINFYARDLFISHRDHVAISGRQARQNHCRKFHCYFLVFQKKIRKVRRL
jgi:hypothetical protein